MPKDTDHQVDHQAEALGLLGLLAKVPGDDGGTEAITRLALVHASLAIAQGQERVAEELWDQNHWLEEIANQLSRAQS
jgi:hypothetical protein